MKRGTGMLKASISLTLLLGSIACTAAAAVTRGDLLLVRRDDANVIENGTWLQVSTTHTPWQDAEAQYEAVHSQNSRGCLVCLCCTAGCSTAVPAR